jgi:cytoplasmic iron level regulating protein YaaA (DUF328/UPF0246 family)
MKGTRFLRLMSLKLFILSNRLEEAEGLKAFAAEGYAFNPAASEANRLVFQRG